MQLIKALNLVTIFNTAGASTAVIRYCANLFIIAYLPLLFIDAFKFCNCRKAWNIKRLTRHQKILRRTSHTGNA